MTYTTEHSGESLALLLDGRPVLGGIRFSAFTDSGSIDMGADGAEVERDEAEGEDETGSYRSSVNRVRVVYDQDGRREVSGRASLEVRSYKDCWVFSGSCSTRATLEAREHFRVEFGETPGLQKALALYLYSDWWSRPHFANDLNGLPRRTQMVLWEREEGGYVCLVPLPGSARTEFSSRTGTAGCDVSLVDPGHAEWSGPCFVAACGEDPYELVRRCVVRGMQVCGHPGKPRWEKPLPEAFQGLGWCTWNALYHNVNEKAVLEKAAEFRNEGLPIRYLLIDDGWSETRDYRLISFDTNPESFPRGLRPLVQDLKGEFGIPYVGVWHTFTGYWQGMTGDSTLLDGLREHILKTKRSTWIPYPEPQRSFGFWNAWHSRLRSEGVDFVKVDNQGATSHHTYGTMPAGTASGGQQRGLQASGGANLSQGILNCMCMALESGWHWTSSNVARNSEDYFPDRPETAPEHARQNVYNNLLHSNFAWPDWDMWWSYGPVAKYHAALRAISGGPVYFTDQVGKGDAAVLWPFVTPAGELLRCDEPAMPCRDVLLEDPSQGGVALKAYNRCGEAGMLLAANAAEGDVAVQTVLSPADVPGLAGDQWAVYEHFTGESRLVSRGERWQVELAAGEARLYVLAPVKDGAAIVGLADKYVSPAAVIAGSVASGGIMVTLKCGGRLRLWSARRVAGVWAEGAACAWSQDEGWMEAETPGDGVVQCWVQFEEDAG